jgi:hypothetical protein
MREESRRKAAETLRCAQSDIIKGYAPASVPERILFITATLLPHSALST